MRRKIAVFAAQHSFSQMTVDSSENVDDERLACEPRQTQR